MSKFFETKKSGVVKSKTMKTGLIAVAIAAVTAAAGVGGYKMMNRNAAPSEGYTPPAATTTQTQQQAAPQARTASSFSTFGFGSPEQSAPAKKEVAKKKHFAKKTHGKKHYAKKKHGKKHKHYAKKKHGKKHYAKKHSKKHKHLAKHKKKNHTTAAR